MKKENILNGKKPLKGTKVHLRIFLLLLSFVERLELQ